MSLVASGSPEPTVGTVGTATADADSGRPTRAGLRQALSRQHPRLRGDRLFVALALIILGGATARLVGGSWGLPLELHPDEWVIVRGALDLAARNSFEPSYYMRPDHVEIKLSYLAYMVYAHGFHGVTPEALYAVAPAPFLLISRTITAAFGIATIVLAYLIGARFTRVIGVMAAFVVAFFPPYVAHAHLATPDVPLTFAFMVVTLACMRYLASPGWGNLLLSSFGVSMAVAIKYPGVLGSVMIAITVVVAGARVRAWGRIVVHGAGAIVAVVGFLFLLSPTLITNAPAVREALTSESRVHHLGADGLGWFGNMGFYAEGFATAAGTLLVVCFLVGLLWSIRLRLVQSIPVWTGVVFWLILSGVPLHWERWSLPMVLTPLLVAPIGAYYTYGYLRERRGGRWLARGAVLLGAVMALNLVAGSVAATARFVAQDTRSFGIGEFAARGIDVTNSVFEGYTPLQPESGGFAFGFFETVGGRLVLSPDQTNPDEIRYLVLSSDMYGRFKADPKYVDQQAFYAQVAQQFPLVLTIDPAAAAEPSPVELAAIGGAARHVREIVGGGLSGPTILVYDVGSDRS